MFHYLNTLSPGIWTVNWSSTSFLFLYPVWTRTLNECSLVSWPGDPVGCWRTGTSLFLKPLLFLHTNCQISKRNMDVKGGQTCCKHEYGDSLTWVGSSTCLLSFSSFFSGQGGQLDNRESYSIQKRVVAAKIVSSMIKLYSQALLQFFFILIVYLVVVAMESHMSALAKIPCAGLVIWGKFEKVFWS